MLTYLILDIAMLGFVALALFLWPQRLPYKRIVLLCLALCVMTAIFDSFIIYEHIVGYDPTKILGTFIFKAPIEDFSYTIAVAFFVPFLWRFYDKRAK